jgi:two-component system chemotaxis sensor kinase CheA
MSVGSQLFALPTVHVERLARVRPEEVRSAEGRDVILTAEAPVPLVSLARLLGPPLREQPVSGPFPVVRLLVGGRRLAVAVDELVAEEEIVVRPLDRVRGPAPLFSGASLLGSGRVAPVLNASAVIDAGLGRVVPGPALRESAAADPARLRLLVVDDSITTRTLEQSILEAAGYQVLTAADGSQGWQLLQENEVDLVVCDVEMPRMDGFELCAAIRASKRLSSLPVVLVTGLESPEHRARGLEAGADAYLPKSSFDQQELLDTIRQLLG